MRKTLFGLTIPEVVMAIGLFSVVFLAIAQVFISGLKLMAQNRELSTATEVARSCLEVIRVGGSIPGGGNNYNGYNPDPSVGGFPPYPYPSVTIDGVIYTVNVTTAPVTGRTDEKSVDVQVTWNASHQMHLQTYFYGF